MEIAVPVEQMTKNTADFLQIEKQFHLKKTKLGTVFLKRFLTSGFPAWKFQPKKFQVELQVLTF